MNFSDIRLPQAFDAAIGQVKAAVQMAAERVASGLASEAESAVAVTERNLALAAEGDLRRKINAFLLSFGKELTDKVQAELTPRGHDSQRKASDWQSLSLVEDTEFEQRMFADRIGQQIAHACEWELRELTAYVSSLLNIGRADEERNPLRPEVLASALFHAIEAVTEDNDARKLLAREFGQAMAQAMPECYAALVRDLQQRNIQPVGLTVKTMGGGSRGYTANSGYHSIHDEGQSTRSQPSDFRSASGDFVSTRDSAASTRPGPYASTGGDGGAALSRSSSPAVASRLAAGVSAEADAQLVNLLRRLTFLASRPGALVTQPQPGNFAGPGSSLAHDGMGLLDAAGTSSLSAGGMNGMMAVNLIRAHRDELRQASSGKLDHMVIDVVGSLFDQILSDPKVSPQMARQIARLQLPVLRVALIDPEFFSSRRHPVRRFVNRIASLSCAFEDFDDGAGKEFLERVKALVQDIVEGDFDQLDVYSSKLTEIETFIDSQTQGTAQSSGMASVLETKESELRVQQRYMMQLQSALADITMPDYLRDFVSQVWSQALVLAVRQQGADSERAKRFRLVGRDLVMSVQPKSSPLMRKNFLAQLPALMKDLTEGMKAVGWPEAAQKQFFGKLVPSHAESLKAAQISELDYNLLAKRLEGIFSARIPGANEISPAEPVAFESQDIEQRFTPEEAKQIGLVQESAVDWSGEVDIDLSADAGDTVPGESPDTTPAELGLDIDLSLAAPDPAEPSHGARLMDHIRIGFAYQMLLKDEWQKVRLGYVSPGRNFFVFMHGRKHQQAISFTSRMLSRMCESNRLRAVEHSYLMERATARARRQLAALKVAGKN